MIRNIMVSYVLSSFLEVASECQAIVFSILVEEK